MADYNKLTRELLDLIEFELVKYEDGYGLVDLQGANLGNIEGDRFDNAESLFDRIEIYLDDYIVRSLEERFDTDLYGDYEGGLACIKSHFDVQNDWDIQVIDMVVNHANEVNLSKCINNNDE